jgi:molybdate transport system regulatory protein
MPGSSQQLPPQQMGVGRAGLTPSNFAPVSTDAMLRRSAGSTLTMDTKLTLRVDLGNGRALGPGKIGLLEAIEKTGSISQAGRKLGMSYRRAWLLVDDMNGCFDDPVIEAQPGGTHGGGANLTSFGQKLIERYRAIEAEALVATRKHMRDIEAALKATKASRPPTSLKRAVRGGGSAGR